MTLALTAITVADPNRSDQINTGKADLKGFSPIDDGNIFEIF